MMCFVYIDSEGVVTNSWTLSVKMSEHVSMMTSSEDAAAAAAAAAGWYHIEYTDQQHH